MTGKRQFWGGTKILSNFFITLNPFFLIVVDNQNLQSAYNKTTKNLNCMQE